MRSSLRVITEPITYGRGFKAELWDVYNKRYVSNLEAKECGLTKLRPIVRNQLKLFKTNKFAINSLVAIGGGAMKHLKEARKYIRFGGSTYDKALYMSCYVDNSFKSYEYLTDFDEMSRFLSTSSGLSILSSKDTLKYANINFEAVPGITIRSLGFNDKEEAMRFYIPVYNTIYAAWCLNCNSSLMPSEIWSAGSRPKLFKMEEKAVSSRLAPSTCARVISVGSALEQLIGMPLWHTVMHEIEASFKKTYTGIAIGINRFSDDWPRLASKFKTSKYVFTGDYSRYDMTVPRHLMIRSLDYLLSLFHKNNKYQNNYISNFRKWFIDNVVDKTYIIDSRLKKEVNSGIPSGSLWTSLLNSVCNMFMLEDCLKAYGIAHVCDVVVYGDDHIIFIRDKIRPEKLKNFIYKYTKENFGMINNAEKMRVSRPSQFFVCYKRPIYKVDPTIDLSKGTSNLKPKKFEYSDRPFKDFDYKKGTTHRWSYFFNNRPQFLSFFFLIDGTSIRPWRDTLVRLINPEKPITTVDEHIVVLKSHLADNFNNAHARNWLMHMMYDAYFLKKNYNNATGEFSPNYNIVNNKVVRAMFHAQIPNKGDRMWYRRIDSYVDLTKEPCMERFLIKFSIMLNDIKKNYNSKSTVPFYKKKEFDLSLVRKGYCTKDEINKIIVRSGYFYGLQEALRLLNKNPLCQGLIDKVAKQVVNKLGNYTSNPLNLIYGVFFLKKHDLERLTVQLDNNMSSRTYINHLINNVFINDLDFFSAAQAALVKDSGVLHRFAKPICRILIALFILRILYNNIIFLVLVLSVTAAAYLLHVLHNL